MASFPHEVYILTLMRNARRFFELMTVLSMFMWLVLLVVILLVFFFRFPLS